MCGITGFVHPGLDPAEARRRLAAMTSRLRHRGPDDEGLWLDESAGVALGHRRLSIVDLSQLGHQPMASASGRYHLTFNGEIYNFPRLRRELEGLGASFRGTSDTEVLLAAFEAWGVEKALERSSGMFALVVWDRVTRRLHLSRDRLGEKPLYYGAVGEAFLFASELKAFGTWPGFAPEIDRGAVALLLRHKYVPAPYSIYRGVRKLPPAGLLTLDLARAVPGSGAFRDLPEPRLYWSARQVAERGQREPLEVGEEEAVELLDRELRRAVSEQMVADVPLGAFLSGGLDSSTVVALMQAQSPRPVRTFTIGFEEELYDESPWAAKVARHLGTDHTELTVTAAEAREVIPRLPEMYDEPFSDSSQIPTFLVAQLARRHVTVCLSGDGGDELLGGYKRYQLLQRLWRRVGPVPYPLRRILAGGLEAVPTGALDVTLGWLRPALAGWGTSTSVGDKLHKVANVLRARGPEAIYHRLISDWKEPAELLISTNGHGVTEPATILTDRSRWADLADYRDRLLYFDLLSYLPDDILVKVDRAGMAVSLEGRIPLLDRHVVELAWRLPRRYKLRRGSDGKLEGKWILRQVLHRYVPRELFERPKMGFGVPVGEWIRGPLEDWAEDLLSEDRLRREGYFHPQPIRKVWREHLEGRRNWQYHLWDVLMFQQWLAAQRSSGGAS